MHRNGSPFDSRPAEPQSNVLNRAVITTTLSASPDKGRTLNFSHNNLTEISEDDISELALAARDEDDGESPVSRIALSYNRLANLPVAFALLTKLRYLNLRSNLFTKVPDVLTAMPSLEILDISRNSIKALPEKPGTMIKLQILSMSRNRLTALPKYLASFQKLSVLKVDHNPLHSIPDEVIQAPPDVDDPNVMNSWISRLKSWLLEQSDQEDFGVDTVQPLPVKSTTGGNFATEGDDNSNQQSQDLKLNTTDHLLHMRTASYDSTSSAFSMSTSEFNDGPYSLADHPIQSSSESPAVSPLTSISSHVESEHFNSQHDVGTGLSFIGDRSILSSSTLGQKQSLPELPLVLTNQHLEGTDPSSSKPGIENLNEDVSHRVAFSENIVFQPTSVPNSMSVERNSYFKRLSIHLSTQVAKPAPLPLLMAVDAVRGVYYAIHQIYEQVGHYTTWTVDDRISGVLRKVLEPARVYTTQLISALDCFDAIALSGKGTPSPLVCRGVFESCKDNVSVCIRVIAALQLQLKVLAGADDVRFTRSLVLMLYGSMSELVHSWQAISAQLPDIRRFLALGRKPLQTSGSHVSTNVSGTTHMSGHSESSLSVSGNRPPVESADNGRSRSARRHAGSFSVKNLQFGKSIRPHADEPPLPDLPILARDASSTSSSGETREAHSSKSPSSPNVAEQPNSDHIAQSHINRFGNQLPSIHQTTVNNGGNSSDRVQYMDLPSDSSRIVDQELSDTLSSTLDSANTLWPMIQDVVSASSGGMGDLGIVLEDAILVTNELSRIVGRLRETRDTNKKIFPEAFRFVKAVTQVSSELKAFSATQALPSTLRVTAAKVVQLTKEMAVLLHVSSYSPSVASTPTPHFEEESLLAPAASTNLSRSRSAQPTVSNKMLTAVPREEPRSALPNQKFHFPAQIKKPSSAYRSNG